LKFFAVLTIVHHGDQAFPTLRATRPFHRSLQSNGYLPKKQLRSKKRLPPLIPDQSVALGYDCDARREPSRRTAAPDARCSSSAGYSENGLLDFGHGDIFHHLHVGRLVRSLRARLDGRQRIDHREIEVGK
jgi:hypothetical protein